MEKTETAETVLIDELPPYEQELPLEWTLSMDDIHFILQSVKGEQQIIYFAATLKSLRNTGDFFNYENKLPNSVIHYLSKQLDIQPTTLLPVSRNSETSYRQKIKNYLGYCDFSESGEKLLKDCIIYEMQKELFSLEFLKEKMFEILKTHKIIRPATTIFDRLIASYRKEAIESLYEKLANKLTSEQKSKLLLMLKRQPHLFSQINYYKKSPPEPTAAKINIFIQRFEELNELGITQIDFSNISEVIFNQLSLLGQTYDANAIHQLRSENKKIALLLCSLVSASQTILDHILDMNDKLLAKKERISRNLYSQTLKKINKQAKKGLKFLIKTTKEWWHHQNPNDITLSVFKETINDQEMTQSLNACEQLSTYQTSGYYEILERKYSDLRKYTINLFQLDFKGAPGTEPLLESIKILKQLNQSRTDKLPHEVPTHFVPKVWRKAISKNKKLSRRTWEMALYYEIKNSINKGDIYLEHSKKHNYFWNTVYSESQWEKEKPTAFKALGFPEKFDDLLTILKKEYFNGIELAKKHLHADSFAFINSAGELQLRKDDKLNIPDSTIHLKKIIESKMELVRIEKMLADIDIMHNFSQFFTSPDGFEQKIPFDLQTLYAAIVALGTNLGFIDMSNSTTGISLEKLKHVAQWGIRPEVINIANNFLVKKHSEHPLSQLYGNFSWSGSDGERFCIQKSTNLASFYPKAFGYYQKVITIYTHLSDQFSVFGTQVISCGEREASYVLNGLLNHQMITNPHFHCTDTGGFTHQLFALCYLLGFSFQPRLKDLADQTLYKLHKNDHYGEIDSIFNGHVDLSCIAEQWEQLIRIIISLKNQVAPAHLVLQRLAARSGSDRVAKAIMELGKLIKTIYILHYISKPELRRKVHLQLNRGESRHHLARHIFFANQGEFKTAAYEEIMNIASCLSLLSNAVLLWNTPKIYNIVEDLRRSGIQVNDEDLKRISPLMFKHLIVHGTYDFKGAMAGINYPSN